MNKDVSSTLKGIIIVIVVTTLAIFIGLKIMNKNYVYILKYYEQENLYKIMVTDDYDAKLEITVVCKEEKCKGNYGSVVSQTTNITKENAENLVKTFHLNRGEILETNEEIVNDEQLKIIKKIIN